MNLTHVRLLVKNFPECFRFYRDVLGREVRLGEEDGVYAEFDAGDCVLALFRAELMDAALGQRPSAVGGDQVVLTMEVASVDSAFDDLRGQGVTFIAPPTDRPDWFLRTAHFRDPDGNLIEIYENLEGEEHEHPHD